MACDKKRPVAIGRLCDLNSEPLFRQHMLYNITPLNYYNYFFVANYLSKLIGHDPSLVQAVKIKMVDLKLRTSVHLANSKGGAGNFVRALGSTRQAADKSGLATAKVAY